MPVVPAHPVADPPVVLPEVMAAYSKVAAGQRAPLVVRAAEGPPLVAAAAEGPPLVVAAAEGPRAVAARLTGVPVSPSAVALALTLASGSLVVWAEPPPAGPV